MAKIAVYGAGAVGSVMAVLLAEDTPVISMLQDLLAGRPLEVDAQLVAVQQLARAVNVVTPALDSMLALLLQRLKATAR